MASILTLSKFLRPSRPLPLRNLTERMAYDHDEHWFAVLVRQRGTHIHPGVNVGRGSDDTLYAKASGVVRFERLGRDRKQVSVYEA